MLKKFNTLLKIRSVKDIYLKAGGDSMAPVIEPGDIVLAHKQSDAESGALAVVLLDRKLCIRKVIRGGARLELHPLNPKYPIQSFYGKERKRVKIIGVVKRVSKAV